MVFDYMTLADCDSSNLSFKFIKVMRDVPAAQTEDGHVMQVTEKDLEVLADDIGLTFSTGRNMTG